MISLARVRVHRGRLGSSAGRSHFTPRGSKVPRRGVLLLSAADPNFPAFRQGLRDLGHVEGQNLVIELRTGETGPLAVWQNWQVSWSKANPTSSLPLVGMWHHSPSAQRRRCPALS